MNLEIKLTDSQIRKVLPYYIFYNLNLNDSRLAKLRIHPYDLKKVKRQFILGISCLLISIILVFCFFFFGIYDFPLYISIPVFMILSISILLSGKFLNPCILMLIYRFFRFKYSKPDIYHITLCDNGVFLPPESSESQDFYGWDSLDSILYTEDIYILQFNTPRTSKTGKYRIAFVPTEEVSPNQLKKWIGSRSIATSEIYLDKYPLWY